MRRWLLFSPSSLKPATISGVVELICNWLPRDSWQTSSIAPGSGQPELSGFFQDNWTNLFNPGFRRKWQCLKGNLEPERLNGSLTCLKCSTSHHLNTELFCSPVALEWSLADRLGQGLNRRVEMMTSPCEFKREAVPKINPSGYCAALEPLDS